MCSHPEDAKLGVGNAHVCLVGLHVCCRDRLKLGCRGGVEEFFQDGEVEVLACPANEFLEVYLGDRADGVELDCMSILTRRMRAVGWETHIGRAGIVFGEIAPQTGQRCKLVANVPVEPSPWLLLDRDTYHSAFD